MSLKKACLIVKATNSRVGSLRLPTLGGWLLIYELPDQNKLNKTACLKMQFMSRVFPNTTSLMTSVCMLYVGAMAASSYLS